MRSVALLVIAGSLSGAAWADPLQDFEALVRQCQQSYDARPAVEVVYAELAKSWVKRSYTPASLKYDVRKTDSLVSPLVARLEIGESVVSARAADEAAAKALDLSAEPVTLLVRVINYAHRSGKWELVDGKSIREFRGRPSAVVLSRDDLLAMTGPMASCRP